MDSRARWGGDKGHALRIIRQGPFALLAEIAQSCQLALAGLKGLRKQPLARWLHQLHGKLILAARRIQGDAPCAQHIQPVAQKLQRRRTRRVKNLACQGIKPLTVLPLHVPEPHALQLRIGILEGKIDVPGAGTGQVGHLAPHPDKGETSLKGFAQLFREFTDRQYGFLHGAPRAAVYQKTSLRFCC